MFSVVPQLVVKQNIAAVVKNDRILTRCSTGRKLNYSTKISCTAKTNSATSVSRRLALGGLGTGIGLWTQLFSSSTPAQAGFEKYIKKKPLDPIDTYVPSIILTRDQFSEIELTLETDASVEDRVEGCKLLLREGPAGGMRDNMRSVTRYVNEQNGETSAAGKAATEALNSFFANIDTLDSKLLAAKRDDNLEPKRVAEANKLLAGGLAAIDKLLSLLPESVLTRSQAIADASSSKPVAPSVQDPVAESEVTANESEVAGAESEVSAAESEGTVEESEIETSSPVKVDEAAPETPNNNQEVQLKVNADFF